MIRFKLYSLNGLKFDDDVAEITLPTLSGNIGVLKDHMPLVSVATNGVVSIRRRSTDRDEDRESFAISGGAIQVENNVVKLLVDEADHADEINDQEVKEAMARAQKLKEDAKDQLSLDRAQAMIDRQAVRLQVASLKRRKKV